MTKIKKWTKVFMMFTAPVVLGTSLLTLTSCSSNSNEESSSNSNEPNFNPSLPPASTGTIAADETSLEGTYNIGEIPRTMFLSDVVYNEHGSDKIAVTYSDTHQPIVYNWSINIDSFTTYATFNSQSEGINNVQVTHTLNNIHLNFDTWFQNNKWNYTFYGLLDNPFNALFDYIAFMDWENQVFYLEQDVGFHAPCASFIRLYYESEPKLNNVYIPRFSFDFSLSSITFGDYAQEWKDAVKDIHDIHQKKMSLIGDMIIVSQSDYSTISNGTINISIKK